MSYPPMICGVDSCGFSASVVVDADGLLVPLCSPHAERASLRGVALGVRCGGSKLLLRGVSVRTHTRDDYDLWVVQETLGS